MVRPEVLFYTFNARGLSDVLVPWDNSIIADFRNTVIVVRRSIGID